MQLTRYRKIIAKNIAYLRRYKKRKRQWEMAIELDITKARIGSWEEFRSSPGIDMLIRLAAYFEVTLEDLCTEELFKTERSELINS